MEQRRALATEEACQDARSVLGHSCPGWLREAADRLRAIWTEIWYPGEQGRRDARERCGHDQMSRSRAGMTREKGAEHAPL